MRLSRQDSLIPPHKPLLIVLSGPSGAGKDAVLQRVKTLDLPLCHVTTVTTRSPRHRERDGLDYRFISVDAFQQLRQKNELLEWAEVYGNWYGVPKQPVREALARGEDVLVKVDVQGAATIKELVPQAVYIFLTPPSLAELLGRLTKRRTETPEELELRTRTAEAEMKQLHLFDYVVFNRQGEAERAADDVRAIISAEKCRVKRREISIPAD